MTSSCARLTHKKATEMANFTGKARTSYFQVKDAIAFRKKVEEHFGEIVRLVEETRGDEDTPYFAILGSGHDGLISLLAEYEGEEEECEYDSAYHLLQDHVHPDWAIIMHEIGSEKMRYLVGCATFITSDEVVHRSFEDAAVDFFEGRTVKKTSCSY